MLDRVTGPECPDCGCEASRIVASRPMITGSEAKGTLALWMVERRECKHCGCEYSHQIPRKPEPQSNGSTAPVRYQPVLCPRCGGKRTPVQSTRGFIRHHRCGECGLRFKSWEADDAPKPPKSRLRRHPAEK